MSEFFRDENEMETEKEIYKDEYSQFETIFSAPQEKKPEKHKKSVAKRQIMVFVSSMLALGVLIGSTVAIKIFVPEKDEVEPNSSNALYNDFSLIKHDIENVNSVTVTNKNGTYKFVPQTQKSEDTGDEIKTWSIEGINPDYFDTAEVEVVIKAAISVTSKRTITEKTASDCGFDKPVYTVSVEGTGFNSYKFYVGNDSPDYTGTYLKMEGDDDIHLVYDMALLSFDFEPTDFAKTEKIPATEFATSITAYCGDDGALKTFDTLDITTEKLGKTINLIPNKDEALANYLGYILTSENNRYADSGRVLPVFKYFSEGLSVAGAFAYDVTPQSLEKYGLNNPDATVTISVAGEKHWFKFSSFNDTHCAVINDKSTVIQKVAYNDLAFLEYFVSDFYAPYVYIRAISEVSNLTGIVGGETYSFDIKENEDADAKEECTVTIGGKKIGLDNFQDFYEEIIRLTSADYEITNTTEKPSMTMIFTDSKTGKKTKVEYTKVAATKYQYSIDGVPSGRIVSSEFNKIAKYFKMVANDKKIK